jgi:coenzyme F420-reducing hydrogenase alpha subunit
MEAFEEHFIEEHVAHSNALHARRPDGSSYQVGPLARINLNHDKLSPMAKDALNKSGLTFPNNNPFLSIVARSLELVHAFEESLHIIETYEEPVPSHVGAAPQAGEGRHITEAPRGMLYHRYRLDQAGIIKEAQIIPPTSQNLKRIEDDLRSYVPDVIDQPLEEATWRCEQLVRNYDPCISCATHFLNLSIKQV